MKLRKKLGVSVPYAYKLIRELNEEAAKDRLHHHCRQDRPQVFHEKFYGTREQRERKESNGGI